MELNVARVELLYKMEDKSLDEVQELLCKLSKAKLVENAQAIKVAAVDALLKKTCFSLRNSICSYQEEHMEEETGADTVEAVKKMCQEYVEVPNLEEGEAEKTKLDEEKNKILLEMQKLKEQFETSLKTHEENLSKLGGSLKVESASAVPPPVKTATAEAKVANLSQFKREFKVNGTISDSRAQNKLAFCGLIRQLNAAMGNGYTEAEVVDGVIKAMVPGSAMHSYLETTTIDELTLPKLWHILRSHYKEKSATELFQDLMNIVQGRREDTQAFLMCGLNLRQKVLFVSQEANSKLQANPDLVQTVFLQALENGLQSEALRVKLRPFLTEPRITEEVLREQFSTAIMSEEERKKKLLQAMHDQPSTKMNKVFVSESENQSPAASHEAVSKRSKKQQQEDKLMAAIQAVQQDVNALKERFNEAPQNSYSAPVYQSQDPRPRNHQPRSARKWGRPRPPQSCPFCQEQNTGQRCNHCFSCGSTDHWLAHCPHPNTSNAETPSGNG